MSDDGDLISTQDPVRFRDPTGPAPTVTGLQYSPEPQMIADAFGAFTRAARALKGAELAFRDAQQVYAEAVKRLSEEAVK